MADCRICFAEFDGEPGQEVCDLCGEKLDHEEDLLSLFRGDYNLLHPNETDEEFWEHEDCDYD